MPCTCGHGQRRCVHGRLYKQLERASLQNTGVAYLLFTGDRDGGRARGVLFLEPGVGAGSVRGDHGGQRMVVRREGSTGRRDGSVRAIFSLIGRLPVKIRDIHHK